MSTHQTTTRNRKTIPEGTMTLNPLLKTRQKPTETPTKESSSMEPLDSHLLTSHEGGPEPGETTSAELELGGTTETTNQSQSVPSDLPE